MNRIARSNTSTSAVPGLTKARRLRAPNPLLLAAIAAVLVSGSYSPASALTYYVEGTNAACSNSGAGTELQPYCTISAAVTARGAAGNTIIVKPGTYREQVTINASGVSGSPLILQAQTNGVVISGADAFTNAAQWTLVSGNVWLASGVTWYPRQVFLDGARCDSSQADPAALTARTFRWVSGTGLYVNAGGGNPASHAAQVGRRNYGFSLFGRSWITIDGFNVIHSEDRGVYLNGSCTNVTVLRNTVTYTGKMGIQVVGGSANRIASNSVHDCMDHGIAFITGATGCTIEDNESSRNARPVDRVANGIYLFGCPNNIIRQNRTFNNEDTGIHIQSGSNNCIVTLNRSWNNGDHGYDHLGATGTIHNCDVSYGNFRDGFSIEGTATGTQLHNCISTDNGLTTSGFDLWVDASSVTGFVSNYNIIWNSTAQAPVGYAGTTYPTVAAYSLASSQDAQTLQSNPMFVSPASGNFHIQSTSPAIDNANSGSPNWPTNDADDNARFNVTTVPNTGVGPVLFADRGAYEFRTTSVNQAPNGVIDTPTGNVTIIAGQSVSFTGTGTDPDNDLPLTFAWNFGGGAPSSSLEDPGATVFSTAGTYTVSFTITDALGLPDPTPATRTITVTANTAPNGVIDTPTGNVTIAAGQSVNFTGTGTDANNNLPLTYLWNFGGGATNSTVQDPGNVTFATGGTYTVTFTVTDALGLADPTPATRTITVTSPTNQAPNGVIDTPTANVTIIAGQSVSFTGTGTDPNNNLPLTFLWNFGGGATNSTVEDPGIVVFATAGTFTVSFTVTDALGLADPTPATRVITVNANTAPNGVINTPTANVTIAAGQSVNFTGTGTDANNNLPLTFLWNFGGGATNSTVEDPGSIVFLAAGTYNVTFTVTDAIGLADPTPATRTITVTGNQAPNGVINTPTAAVTITAGQSVNFTGTGTDPNNNLPLTFLWNFGGGATNSTVEDPGNVVFATAGTYTVTFTVTDALGLADLTPDTRVITVNPAANQAPNGVINTPTAAVTITAGQSVNFTGTGTDANNNLPLTFAWNFGGGATNSTVEDPGNVVFATAGTFTVSFTVTDALGLADATPDTRVITVNANTAPNGVINTPTAAVTIAAGQSVNFTGTGTDANNNLPLTFLWNFGGGATNSTVEDPGNVVFTTAGTFTVSFTVTDALGLADATPDTRVITVTGPANTAPNGVINTPTAAVTITAGQSVNFTGTGTDPNNNLPLTFLWNFGGGATNSTVEDPGNVVFATAGTFTVSFTVTDALGLADATPDTRVITVTGPANQAPNGLISAPTAAVTIAAGQSVTFAGAGTDPDNNLPLTYLWNFGGGAANSTIQNPGAVVFNTAGTFTVSFTVTDALGLADATPDTRVVTVTGGGSGPCANNLVANPSFESGITGWKGIGATLAQVAGGSVGAFSCRVTGPASTSSYYIEDSPRSVAVPVAGTSYHFAASVRSELGRGSARIRIMEYVNGLRVATQDSPPVTLSAAWQRLEIDYTATATGSNLYFSVKNQPVAVSEVFDIDDASVCPGTPPPANQAPNGVINTPTAAATIAAGQSVNFTGTGTDPDNNLPLTFAWNFGGGAVNSTVEDPGNVVFTAPGTYTVSFTVRDGLGLADATPDTRVITVTGTNQAPNGVINTPTAAVTITAGQSVNFTGTGTDPNNNLPLTYLWNFGGGATNSTVQNPGLVAFNTAGTFTVSFTVTDALGLADPTPDTRVVTVTDGTTGPCASNLVTNPSFETGIAGWKGVGGTIAQVAGGAVGSFSCRVTGPASTSSFYIEDSPRSIVSPTAGRSYHFSAQVRSDLGQGSTRIRIMEYVAGLRVATLDSPPVTLSPNWQRLDLDYTATATGSTIYFTVKNQPLAVSEAFDVDDASVCPGPVVAPLAAATLSERPEGALDLQAFVVPRMAPNPMGRQATLTFSTFRPGPLRVFVYDVSGRRVRTLLDESDSPAGLHVIQVDSRGDNGALSSGIYFYRIHSAEGARQGRFVIMQ